MTRRLGKATVELRGQAVLFVLFDDGRATCEHVAAGAASVSSGNGHISARKHRAEPFTIHRCASCDRRFGPTREQHPAPPVNARPRLGLAAQET
jgi:hypothetical protein